MSSTNLDHQGEEEENLPRIRLTPRQLRFCELVVMGYTYTEAYRVAYLQPKLEREIAGERGWRVTQGKGVKARIEQLRRMSGAKTLLTMNDRLQILANFAQSPSTKPSDRIRAIEAYSKIAGDQAPERHELTGPDGTPIPVHVTAGIGRIPVKQRIEMLRRSRAAEKEIPQ